ncbi:MAG: hypothetical protein RL196_375 [Actinomycetota bacterium]|jgi:two-component system sensor histidine kinase SenX3
MFFIFDYSRIRQIRLQQASQTLVPVGVAEVLDVLATAGIVLGPGNNVLRSTPSAQVLGLVRGSSLNQLEIAELADRARETGDEQSIEVELTTGLQGDTIFVSARAARLESGQVLVLVDDRTDAKRVEETRRDFVDNVSHELKTPIAAVGLLAEALRSNTSDPAKVEKFSTHILQESQRMGNLVQDIIQLSKLQSAEQVGKPQLLDLTAVVAEAVERNKFLAENKHIRIRTATARGIKVYGDHDMLTMAVKNLIENAIIYSETRGQVGVGLREVEGVAEITVADNGVGIPDDEQDRIFERFYRVDASRSRQTGGTGLGLSIVKHVALNHRGEVRLFSQLGLGSTFTLRLPMAQKISVSEPKRKQWANDQDLAS